MNTFLTVPATPSYEQLSSACVSAQLSFQGLWLLGGLIGAQPALANPAVNFNRETEGGINRDVDSNAKRPLNLVQPMKVRRMNKPYWSIPLEELERDVKRMLNMQWREFVYQLEDAESVSFRPVVGFERNYLEASWKVA